MITKVQVINNAGTGSLATINIETPEGVKPTVTAVLKENGLHADADLMVRVNKQPASLDTELKEGDRVTIAPKKVAGARR